ncbi:MAG: hypothetical protein NZ992_00160 [Candidatus Korarchaeum sp.]|nr:hypothetical protein [Candidatus Korarchaeum sp.]MDW8093334.1 hypothetical protein [Nitrososphaerota archaeon]
MVLRVVRTGRGKKNRLEWYTVLAIPSGLGLDFSALELVETRYGRRFTIERWVKDLGVGLKLERMEGVRPSVMGRLGYLLRGARWVAISEEGMGWEFWLLKPSAEQTLWRREARVGDLLNLESCRLRPARGRGCVSWSMEVREGEPSRIELWKNAEIVHAADLIGIRAPNPERGLLIRSDQIPWAALYLVLDALERGPRFIGVYDSEVKGYVVVHGKEDEVGKVLE